MSSKDNLVIVESPAKAKTIKKYLGGSYDVIASVGHVRDLPLKRLGVDVKNNFEPTYSIIKDKKDFVKEIKEKALKFKKVILATDPDREGEAISWHLAHILKLDSEEKNRVTFNEITKSGIKAGISSPRKIDFSLVDAQQARRVLDRLVGYKLSPFLCQKIQKGLSAGRVQSVALKMIVDRENEIRAFVPQEYWTITATLLPKPKEKVFLARFWGDKNGEMKLLNEAQTKEILLKVENSEYKVIKLKKGKRNKSPAPPFITSTLQQDASRKLGFTSKRIMKSAQELYEGVDIKNHGAVGLITYVRTDSLRLSEESIEEAEKLIAEKWGKRYLPPSKRKFKSKSNSQDAHEAIRPTNPGFFPENIKESLTPDQFKIYNLIWRRFMASQMANCIQDTVRAEIEASGYIFKASGISVAFDGFTIIYTETKDEKEEKEKMLPELSEGTECQLKKIDPEQHFTEPPPRFTEASLIKSIEENGVGRPSTYSSIISVLIYREYIIKESKIFKPTELGEVVANLIKKYFPYIVNVKFTASMETQLDEIERGQVEWREFLRGFYGNFEKTLEIAKEKTKDLKISLKENETDIVCEKCGRQMVVKRGRYGKFIACPGYPECQNIKKFIQSIGIKCPKCDGEIVKRSAKKGNFFYGCSNFPNCDFISSYPPAWENCLKCGKPMFKKKDKVFCIECSNQANS
ncbi:MAG: type I DNA topoisomerase [Oscillospiraceae bacterium]|jgi:DNA topoisomerase-1|nr:type I DNA topoisomerase [Oscillospiraceae bacterium]